MLVVKCCLKKNQKNQSFLHQDESRPQQIDADFELLFLHENQMGCPNTSGGVGVGLLSAFMSQQIRRPS